jgi:DNA-binding transcriptional LysR family regulator
LDAGFVFNMPKTDPELDQVLVASQRLVLRELADADFVWFPRRQSPAYYDRLMQACSRGGLTTPRIVQEAVDQATMLSLVACRLGVAFVSDATRWRCPKGVVLRAVVDMYLPIAFSLAWRKDSASPLLARFVAEVRQRPDVRALARSAE